MLDSFDFVHNILTGNSNLKNHHREPYRRVSQVWTSIFRLCIESTGYAGSDEEL